MPLKLPKKPPTHTAEVNNLTQPGPPLSAPRVQVLAALAVLPAEASLDGTPSQLPLSPPLLWIGASTPSCQRASARAADPMAPSAVIATGMKLVPFDRAAVPLLLGPLLLLVVREESVASHGLCALFRVRVDNAHIHDCFLHQGL